MTFCYKCTGSCESDKSVYVCLRSVQKGPEQTEFWDSNHSARGTHLYFLHQDDTGWNSWLLLTWECCGSKWSYCMCLGKMLFLSMVWSLPIKKYGQYGLCCHSMDWYLEYMEPLADCQRSFHISFRRWQFSFQLFSWKASLDTTTYTLLRYSTLKWGFWFHLAIPKKKRQSYKI